VALQISQSINLRTQGEGFAICKFVKLLLSWERTLAEGSVSVNRAGQRTAPSRDFGLRGPPERKEKVEIEVRNRADVKIIKLRGRLNLGEAVDRMRETFEDLLNAGATRFVVDLGEVSMVDSSGIGLLVRCLTAAKQNTGSLKLLSPSKFAVQTLRMTGLLSLFEVFDDQEKAVESFQ
jgi:anti-sigma B factor antagonist